jgi:hypothetical protein
VLRSGAARRVLSRAVLARRSSGAEVDLVQRAAWIGS